MWLRKSTAGKISRTINRDRYLRLRERADDDGGARPTGVVQSGGSTLAEVRRCVERVLSQLRRGHRARITNDDPLISSGLIDSLGLIELIDTIEADCQVSIPAQALADVSNIDTLRRLAELVERLRTDGIDHEDVDTFPRCREDVPLRIGEPRTPRRTKGFWSWYYRWVLWRRGVRVGRGLRVLGPLILRFDGDPGNISIGNDVTLMPGVDLKVRENGRITLHDGVLLDTNVRLVAAREGHIELGEDVRVGMSTIINAGADVIVGRRTAIAGFGLITASEHKYLSREPFMQQGHQHDPVYIGEDVWGAANVFVGRGSRIGNGAVLGVKSVVRGDVPAYGVVMGNPGRVIRFRS
jgi:acetyltransferase-like isoleucine patch superfamily enzyme/acyl carrier protein